MNKLSEIKTWFNDLVIDASFSIEWIPLSKSKTWFIKNGIIQHISSRFFKIVGIKFIDSNKVIKYQPIIDQWEIGTLAFLLRKKDKLNEILVQAKIEPGNSNLIQLSPTYQATKSNSMRVHGGERPPFYNIFRNHELKIVSSSLQSEQGTRFLNKRNRNSIVRYDHDLDLLKNYKWLRTDFLFKLLDKDFMVNTDARSVLICSSWHELVNRIPFTRYNSKFSKELKLSFFGELVNSQVEKMKKDLRNARKSECSCVVIPIQKLKTWRVDKRGITPLNGSSFKVRHLKVFTNSREVKSWDQPIIDSNGNGYVDLICGRIDNILVFNFSINIEPGLYNKAELSPTICIEPGEIKYHDILEKFPSAKVKKTVFQSDEGGRFYKDVTRYRIIDIGQADLNLKGYWLNLAQIQKLLLLDGWFTNESRSVLSLLLCWI